MIRPSRVTVSTGIITYFTEEIKDATLSVSTSPERTDGTGRLISSRFAISATDLDK